MDWKNVIADIQRHGQMTQPQIAEKVGCGQATISDLVNGSTKQPRYPLGVALVELLKHVSHGSEPQKATA
jgi:hypothetical protein